MNPPEPAMPAMPVEPTTPEEPVAPAEPSTSPESATPAEPADKNLSPGDVLEQTLAARAQRAEQQAADLESAVARLQAELDQSRAAVVQSDRLHQLDLALSSAGAVDLDTARLLAQRLIGQTPDAPADDLVATLVGDKPFLFRAPSRSGHSAMAPSVDANDAGLLDAADRAARTGDRASVLAYLRARRGA